MLASRSILNQGGRGTRSRLFSRTKLRLSSRAIVTYGSHEFLGNTRCDGARWSLLFYKEEVFLAPTASASANLKN
jgi:hypothetical protein